MTDIMKDVGIPINQIQRVTPIITWYLLGYIAAMPLLGRASDRFGRKLLLQVSLASFAVGLGGHGAVHRSDCTLVIGRAIQGTASGALLPVTLALAADLWAAAQPRRGARRDRCRPGAGQRARPAVRHRRGLAAQQLAGRVLDQRAAGRDRDGDDPLQPAVAATDATRPRRSTSSADCCWRSRWAWPSSVCTTPLPTASRCCPSYGLPLLIGASGRGLAFFVWERFARTRLIEPAGVHFRPFLAALGSSLCAGAALMVTLVNVELFGQGVLGKDQNQAASCCCGSWPRCRSARCWAAGSPPGSATARWPSSGC